VDSLRVKLGYTFTDPELLERALTHKSRSKKNQERLEFLGDAVLGLVAAELLFHSKPEAPEGDLTRYRARLVRGRTLTRIATDLELGDHIRLGPGELKSGGFRRDSILEDAMEAIIGAIYLDSGLAACQEVIGRLWSDVINELPDADQLRDPKTKLQEWLQARGHAVPVYEVLSAEGPDHARVFTVKCTIEVEDAPSHIASGDSRRKAEQAAAKLAIEALRTD
jgi:ribonuclease-3